METITSIHTHTESQSSSGDVVKAIDASATRKDRRRRKEKPESRHSKNTGLIAASVKESNARRDGERDAEREARAIKRKEEFEEKRRKEEERQAEVRRSLFETAIASLKGYDYDNINDLDWGGPKGTCFWKIVLSVLTLLGFHAVNALAEGIFVVVFLWLCWFFFIITLAVLIIVTSRRGITATSLRARVWDWTISSFWLYRFFKLKMRVREQLGSAEAEFADWELGFDQRPSNFSHVPLTSPESRVTLQYRSSSCNRTILCLPFGIEIIVLDVVLADSYRDLRPSLALLAELSNADICGMNKDLSVARDRIENQLRSIKSVNLNKFTVMLDGVYQDTAIVASVLWRQRLARVADLPYF